VVRIISLASIVSNAPKAKPTVGLCNFCHNRKKSDLKQKDQPIITANSHWTDLNKFFSVKDEFLPNRRGNF